MMTTTMDLSQFRLLIRSAPRPKCDLDICYLKSFETFFKAESHLIPSARDGDMFGHTFQSTTKITWYFTKLLNVGLFVWFQNKLDTNSSPISFFELVSAYVASSQIDIYRLQILRILTQFDSITYVSYNLYFANTALFPTLSEDTNSTLFLFLHYCFYRTLHYFAPLLDFFVYVWELYIYRYTSLR